jgi:ribosomal protein S18 acetylase RimI-like enzyme
MDLEKENIENLTSLWKAAGEKAGRHLHNNLFDMSLNCNSDWPNRLWFHHSVDKGTIKKAIDLMGIHLSKITIPIWGSNLSNSSMMLEGSGFKYSSSLIGMSISLDQDLEDSGRIRLEKVTNELSAILWSKLFEKSFGYLISEDVILKSKDVITYLIAFHGNDPVGTSVLYFHQPSIAGIHSVGVIPEKRRKGFAEEIMKQLLRMASGSGAQYATLQASDLGKGLYLKLGFQEQFTIKNYVKS